MILYLYEYARSARNESEENRNVAVSDRAQIQSSDFNLFFITRSCGNGVVVDSSCGHHRPMSTRTYKRFCSEFALVGPWESRDNTLRFQHPQQFTYGRCVLAKRKRKTKNILFLGQRKCSRPALRKGASRRARKLKLQSDWLSEMTESTNDKRFCSRHCTLAASDLEVGEVTRSTSRTS